MTFLTRRSFLSGVAVAATCPNVSFAQPAYPAGLTVRFVVGFPAGGGQDIVGRIVADRLSALWGVPTVVENVQGAGGNLAMDRVAKGPNDGTQVLIVPPGIATNQFLYPHLPFDPGKDLVPLALVASVPNLLCVRKDLPVNSVAELITYAKANPGKLTYASSGVGTTLHLSAELFKKMAGVEMVHVAYRGGAPALNDLVGQSVDLMFDNIPGIIGQARAGTVKPLAITLGRRSSLAPEYPPIADTVPGYEAISWAGVGVRAGTPQPIRDRIEADARTVCREPAVRERLAQLVTEVVGSSAQEFSAFIAAERSKWGSLIPGLKLRVE